MNPTEKKTDESVEFEPPSRMVSLKPVFALFIVLVMIASALASVGLFLFQMGVFH